MDLNGLFLSPAAIANMTLPTSKLSASTSNLSLYNGTYPAAAASSPERKRQLPSPNTRSLNEKLFSLRLESNDDAASKRQCTPPVASSMDTESLAIKANDQDVYTINSIITSPQDVMPAAVVRYFTNNILSAGTRGSSTGSTPSISSSTDVSPIHRSNTHAAVPIAYHSTTATAMAITPKALLAKSLPASPRHPLVTSYEASRAGTSDARITPPINNTPSPQYSTSSSPPILWPSTNWIADDTKGILSLSFISGCDLYRYAAPHIKFESTILTGIIGWDDLFYMTEVKEFLYTEIVEPYLQNLQTHKQKEVIISGPKGSGLATAIHLLCQLNNFNLVDCRNHAGFDQLEWYHKLISVVEDNAPCVLMMHRYDTRWEAEYRFRCMGHLIDGWHSVKRGRMKAMWLVWVTTAPGEEGIYSGYPMVATTRLPSVVVPYTDTWNSADIVSLARCFFARIALDMHSLDSEFARIALDMRNLDSEFAMELATISENINVLYSPGQVHLLVLETIRDKNFKKRPSEALHASYCRIYQQFQANVF